MLIEKINEIIKCYTDGVALLFGSIMQYMVADKTNKNKIKFFVFILVSSLFTAIYIISPVLEYYKLTNSSFVGSAYALSSIISIQLLNVVVSAVPNAIRDKILKIIGVENDNE